MINAREPGSNLTYLIFGGAGSLGKTLTKQILARSEGLDNVIIYSRDEAKHFHMRNKIGDRPNVVYRCGDIRDFASVQDAIFTFLPDRIINAAALKQVPLCEEHPFEAVQTNIIGTKHVVRAVESAGHVLPAKVRVLSISTDKAVKPINAYGMTKALQEKIHLSGNASKTFDHFFNCVRYGNVLESTGSVIPFFKAKIAKNEPLPITDYSMTRFLLSLDEAVDLIFAALNHEDGNHVFIPKVRSARILDLAYLLLHAAGKDADECLFKTGIRPGEKLHEILVSEEEVPKVANLGDYFMIDPKSAPITPEFCEADFNSGAENNVLAFRELKTFLSEKGVL